MQKNNSRIFISYFLFAFIAIIIVFRVIYIQKSDEKFSSSNAPKFFEIEALRGNIKAENGELLAISMPLYDLHVDFSVIEKEIFDSNINELAARFSKLLKKDEGLVKKEFLKAKESNKKYYPIAKKVNHIDLQKIKKLPIFIHGQNKGGLIIEKRTNRQKPYGILASRTIGILRDENPVGIERSFNKNLSGTNGIQLKQNIGKNRWISKKSEANMNPIAGNDIVTTINIDFQDVVENALADGIIDNNASWGCAVVMEVTTGRVKAIANLHYDTINNQLDEYYNYAIGTHMEPGSTFKLASLISGLEDKKFKIDDVVNTGNGVYKFYDKEINDSKKGGYGELTISDAFIKSSNIFSKIINDSYNDNPWDFINRVYKFGLGKPLNLDLPYSNNLFINNPNERSWSGISIPYMAIGYEMQFSPMHILTFYNAVANDGKMVNPTFIDMIKKQNNVIYKNKVEVLNSSICSKATLNKVKPLLQGVVEYGTAKKIWTDNYSISGKTGTTVTNYSNSDEKKSYQTSFVGFFPSEKPKYSCIVLINDPKGNYHYGGDVAAPVFKEISDKIFAMDLDLQKESAYDKISSFLPKYNTAKSNNLEDIVSNYNQILIHHDSASVSQFLIKSITNHNKNIKNLDLNIMPDLRGYSKREAVFHLENKNIIVVAKGTGKVVSQSIKVGKKVYAGQEVILNFL